MTQVDYLQFENFKHDGFTLLKTPIAPAQIDQLTYFVEKARMDKAAAGLRNLLVRSPEIKSFAQSGPVFKMAQQLLGSTLIPVRAILFDKTPATNWYVTWHQDLSIPVLKRVECEGYGPWSVKDNVVHVQPPAAILEKMVSLRIHLDPCSEKNGPIKFIPGSHRSGILQPIEIEDWRDKRPAVVCSAERGDVIVMRPLILHSSSTAESPEHRRVLHVEYAAAELPAGVQWAEA
ncbi:MAG: phytanoyl-CoA dioxygenase family protein [Candidatus Obscuribacterales bacterium]|nr:phytanoyl-CoA dioxygenase family protein [Candidatus Obscuribacterales bacterium]